MPASPITRPARLALLALVSIIAATFAFQAATPARAATLVVTTTADNESNGCFVGECTLREAIIEANLDTGTHDVIVFNIPGDGTHILQPATPLPSLLTSMTIDGFCATCEGASPNSLGIDQPSDAYHTIVIDGSLIAAFTRGFVLKGGPVTVRGLVFSGWTASAISIQEGDDHHITGCMIGTDVTGQVAAPNKYGLELGNATGVQVGGTNPADRNVISGNTERAIYAFAGENLTIAGNFIGLAKDGTTPMPNLTGGVAILDVSNAVLGGATSAHRNVIAANGVDGQQIAGVAVEIAPSTKIQGNYIGIDRTGAATPGIQGFGVHVFDSNGVQVLDNVISGNTRWGIYAISANPDIFSLAIQGNLIGTDSTGTSAIGNGFGGIIIYNAPGALIGGSAPGQGNTISGNGSGIQVSYNVHGMEILGNRIGTDITGTLPLGNIGTGFGTGHGIRVFSDPSGAEFRIGGNASEGNIIAFNSHHGIYLESQAANEIALRANIIHSNGGRSIELAPNGVDGIDPGDTDSGANGRVNYPELLFARRGENGMEIRANLDLEPNQDIEVEFFVSDVCGANMANPQAKQFLGSFAVPIDADGLVEQSYLAANSTAGHYLTATVTDDLGNTSELAPCIEIEERPRADVDCSDTVNGLDSLAILRELAGYSAGLLPETCSIDPASPDGDADNDGDVDIADAVYARNVAAGLI